MLYTSNITVLEEAALWAIDEILCLLKDGDWHDYAEIIEKCSSTKLEAKIAVSFLREFDFIQVEGNEPKARIHPLMLSFIEEIQRVEKEETSVIRALRVQ
jgi:hypothetical protein